MDGQRSLSMKVIGIGLVLAGLMAVYGCEGDTGPQGPPGTPATFGGVGCNDCHHLNSLAVTDFAEIFMSGLAGTDKVISAGTSTTLRFDATKLPAGETAQSF